jgi:hypothetical protein
MEAGMKGNGDEKAPSIGIFAYFGFFMGLFGPIVVVFAFFSPLFINGGDGTAGMSASGLFLLGSSVYLILLLGGAIVFFIGVFGTIFGFTAKKLARKYNYENPFINSSIYLGYLNIVLAIAYYIVLFSTFRGI